MTPKRLLIFAELPFVTLSRALASIPHEAPDLTAQVLPVLEAGVMALTFVGPDGAELEDLDLAPYAQALSLGGILGLAWEEREGRGWETWREGLCEERLGPADELVVPLEADGSPDMDFKPTTRRELGPGRAHVVRSCLDLGMTALFSCRFGPVRLAWAAGEGRRALTLTRHGHTLRPPVERGLSGEGA